MRTCHTNRGIKTYVGQALSPIQQTKLCDPSLPCVEPVKCYSNRCDGQWVGDSNEYTKAAIQKTLKTKELLCNLTLKNHLLELLQIICNLQISINNDFLHCLCTETNLVYPSEATLQLLYELLTALQNSQFVKFIPDFQNYPIWYLVYLFPVHCLYQNSLKYDLIREKIVVLDENGTTYSIFQLLTQGQPYINYSTNPDKIVVTYAEALSQLEKLLKLALEANNYAIGGGAPGGAPLPL